MGGQSVGRWREDGHGLRREDEEVGSLVGACVCERKRAPRARAETDTAEGQGPAAETVRRCGPAGFRFVFSPPV